MTTTFADDNNWDDESPNPTSESGTAVDSNLIPEIGEGFQDNPGGPLTRSDGFNEFGEVNNPETLGEAVKNANGEPTAPFDHDYTEPSLPSTSYDVDNGLNNLKPAVTADSLNDGTGDVTTHSEEKSEDNSSGGSLLDKAKSTFESVKSNVFDSKKT